MRCKLLALDIDGTLLNSNSEVSPQTQAAVRQAVQAGIRVVLVTGRRYRMALPLAQQLAIDTPVVTASGALIKHTADHRTLYIATLPRSTVLEMLNVVQSGGHWPVVYTDSNHEGFDFYCHSVETDHPELAEYLGKNAAWAREHPELFENPPDDVFATFAIGTQQAMLQLADDLEQALPDQLYVHVLRSPLYAGYMCEISRVDATKWSGLRHLADQWGIADSEICAVGDDVNDIPMIRHAGLGVAMGNAVDEVKAVADRIAPMHDDHGLTEVVKWLIEE